MVGVLAELRRKERTSKVTQHYEFLRNLISDLNKFQILPYDNHAEAIYQTMSPAIKRIGTKDCRIAASAISRNFTVITRNVDDFRRIGAKCEDWTISSSSE